MVTLCPDLSGHKAFKAAFLTLPNSNQNIAKITLTLTDVTGKGPAVNLARTTDGRNITFSTGNLIKFEKYVPEQSSVWQGIWRYTNNGHTLFSIQPCFYLVNQRMAFVDETTPTPTIQHYMLDVTHNEVPVARDRLRTIVLYCLAHALLPDQSRTLCTSRTDIVRVMQNIHDVSKCMRYIPISESTDGDVMATVFVHGLQNQYVLLAAFRKRVLETLADVKCNIERSVSTQNNARPHYSITLPQMAILMPLLKLYAKNNIYRRHPNYPTFWGMNKNAMVPGTWDMYNYENTRENYCGIPFLYVACLHLYYIVFCGNDYNLELPFKPKTSLNLPAEYQHVYDADEIQTFWRKQYCNTFGTVDAALLGYFVTAKKTLFEARFIEKRYSALKCTSVVDSNEANPFVVKPTTLTEVPTESLVHGKHIKLTVEAISNDSCLVRVSGIENTTTMDVKTFYAYLQEFTSRKYALIVWPGKVTGFSADATLNGVLCDAIKSAFDNFNNFPASPDIITPCTLVLAALNAFIEHLIVTDLPIEDYVSVIERLWPLSTLMLFLSTAHHDQIVEPRAWPETLTRLITLDDMFIALRARYAKHEVNETTLEYYTRISIEPFLNMSMWTDPYMLSEAIVCGRAVRRHDDTSSQTWLDSRCLFNTTLTRQLTTPGEDNTKAALSSVLNCVTLAQPSTPQTRLLGAEMTRQALPGAVQLSHGVADHRYSSVEPWPQSFSTDQDPKDQLPYLFWNKYRLIKTTDKADTTVKAKRK